MSKLSAQTSEGPLGAVGLEQSLPMDQRIIVDPLAPKLLRGTNRFFYGLTAWPWLRDKLLAMNAKMAPGVCCLFPCRKRYIEDQLNIAAKLGLTQFVNIGAGMDTLAYRNPQAAKMAVWEIDVQSNIDEKRQRITQALGAVPDNVTLLAVDFDQESLKQATQGAGCDMDVPTFFAMEAVSQYLSADGIRSTFEFLAEAAPTSRLVMTYVRQDFLDGTALAGLEFLYKRVVVKTPLWKWGSTEEQIRALLDRYGWELVEHHESDELSNRYIEPTGRSLRSAPIEPLVLAVKR